MILVFATDCKKDQVTVVQDGWGGHNGISQTLHRLIAMNIEFKGSKKALAIFAHSSLVSRVQATTAEMPFRNGFTSFFTALQFGLTLGGGGEESTSCPFTIEPSTVQYPEDNTPGCIHITHHVRGMDVLFTIHETSVCTGKEILHTRYDVGPPCIEV